MFRFIRVAAALGSCLLFPACVTQAPPSGTVISNVTLVSPERTAPLEHAYVRILDGQIAEVSTRRLKGQTRIDGTGRYLIPGLIDSHVHLAVAPGFPAPMTAQQAAAHPDVVAAALAQDPRSFLYFGFTTVIDLIGAKDRAAQWNALEVRPDAYFCGTAITIGGKVRTVTHPFFSYPLSMAQRILPLGGPGQDTAEAAAARMAADGAICMKTVYDQGFTQTVPEVRALVAAAHARGLPVFMHANRKGAQGIAVAAGVDVIAHGMWRDPNEDPALDGEAREILAKVIRDHIGYQPTTQVIAGLYDMTRPEYLADPALKDVYPASQIALYAKEGATGSPGAQAQTPASRAATQARIKGTLGRAAEVTGILAKSDARLLFGTDTPSDLIYANPAGLNGRMEMNNWIAAGVTETKLFHAMTLDNARALNLEKQIGTIEPGKTANLLLLRANPLVSVKAYDTLETVFLHGHPIPRTTLSAQAAR